MFIKMLCSIPETNKIKSIGFLAIQNAYRDNQEDCFLYEPIAVLISRAAFLEKPMPLKCRCASDSINMFTPVQLFLKPIFTILAIGIEIDLVALNILFLLSVIKTSSISITSVVIRRPPKKMLDLNERILL